MRLLLASAAMTFGAGSVLAQTAVDPVAPANTDRFNGTSDAPAEDIVVTGRNASANGVTNTTPGLPVERA